MSLFPIDPHHTPRPPICWHLLNQIVENLPEKRDRNAEPSPKQAFGVYRSHIETVFVPRALNPHDICSLHWTTSPFNSFYHCATKLFVWQQVGQSLPASIPAWIKYPARPAFYVFSNHPYPRWYSWFCCRCAWIGEGGEKNAQNTFVMRNK